MSHERTVALTRLIDAPRERVFAAWTSAEHLAHWFGPKGHTVTACEADARPGGAFRFCVRSPNGQDYWVRGTYREVEAPAHLLIACTADDGNIGRLEELIEVTFTARGRKTELRLNAKATGASAEAAAMLEEMPMLWARTVSRLDSHLK
jgi:uncharacterized protein YndB with AHSA1/START domain